MGERHEEAGLRSVSLPRVFVFGAANGDRLNNERLEDVRKA